MDLPKTYKGYETKELLELWKMLSTPQGLPKGTPKRKISAMRDLLYRYKIAPVHQHD